MRRVKRIIIGLITTSMLYLSTGCALNTVAHKSEGNVSEPNNISAKMNEVELALAAYDPEVPGWFAVIDAANKKLAAKNIIIKINKIPTSTWEPYYQKMLTLMAAGSTPDIGRIAESYLPILIQKDKVVEITDRMNEIDKSQYIDSAFKGAAFSGGKMYGLPCGLYTVLLYYNKDLFDRAGIKYPSGDWNNPMTWPEFKETAKKLTKGEGADKVYGAYLNISLLLLNQYLLSNNGKRLYDIDGTCTLDYPKNYQMFELFGNMYTEDKSLMRPLDAKVVGYSDMFRAGRVGMMVEGTWFHATAKNINLFKPGIAAIPSNTGKSVNTRFIDAWVIYKGAKHVDAAWEALKAIISTDAFEALAPHGVGGIPVTKATVEKYKDEMIGSQFNDADKRAFIDSMNHTVGASYSVNINDFTQDWSYILEQFSSGILTVEEFINKEMDVITKGDIKKN